MSEPIEPACECATSGFCPRYQIEQSEFTHGRCQGTNCTPEKSNAFRRKWRLQLIGEMPKPIVQDAPHSAQRKEACALRGEATGETVTCPSCRGTVELKLFTCQPHGKCTVGKPVDGIACCLTCHEYKTKPAEVTKATEGERGKRCHHLGKLVTRDSSCWRLCTHTCDKGHGEVKHSEQCQTCGDYET